MPLQIPTRKALVQSGQAYFQTNVPEWDASTSRRSYVGGLIKGTMSALHDWYVALKLATLQFFPQTATGGFLTDGWWSAITHLSPNPATPARGLVVFTGTAGASVAADTILTANGLSYTTDYGVSIVTQSLNIVTLTRSGATVTATTSEPHHLGTGQEVTVSGAVETDYNGDQTIIVTSDTTFAYAISTTPTTPATGSPILTDAWAYVPVTCTTTGQAGNIDNGSTLIASSLTDVDATAIVTFGGVVGGDAAEGQESYRTRILKALGTDYGMFTADEIEIIARQVTGVTRVWVRKAMVDPPTGWPLEGQVFVAFMRDNDSNPFPSSQNVSDVYDRIAELALPAHTAPEDLVVTSPTAQAVDFTFATLTPDTPTMRAAVTASLAQFFDEGVDYGVDIPQDDYRCAIRDTYDTVGRTRLTSFTLSAPSGTVDVGVYSLARLGTVSFP